MQKKTLWNRSYITLLILNTITATAINMLNPIIAKYAVSLGSSLTTAGLLSGTYAVISLLVCPFAGVLSDRMNKKWLMVAATACTALAILGYAFSSSMVFLILFRCLHGLGFSFSQTTNIAFATTYVPEDRLGSGVGYLGVGTALSAAVGTNLGLSLSAAVGYQNTFLVSFGLLLLCALVMCTVPYQFQTPTQTRSFRLGELISLKAMPLACFSALFMGGNSLVVNYLALMGESRGISSVAFFFTFLAVIMLLSRPVAGQVNDRKGMMYCLVPALFCGMMGMCILALTRNLVTLYSAVPFLGIFSGVGQSTLQAESIRLLGKEKRGVATGTVNTGSYTGQALAPIAGGVVSQHFGYGVMYGVWAFALLLGLGALFLYHRSTADADKNLQADA